MTKTGITRFNPTFWLSQKPGQDLILLENITELLETRGLNGMVTGYMVEVGREWRVK